MAETVPTKDSHTFMSVGVYKENGERDDEKFFLGPLPTEGQAVEMVYVGRDKFTGDLRFQLRVKAVQESLTA